MMTMTAIATPPMQTPIKAAYEQKFEIPEKSLKLVNAIRFIIENGMFIVLAHAQIFAAIPEYQFYVQELIYEVEAFLGRFTNETQYFLPEKNKTKLQISTEFLRLVGTELKALQSKLEKKSANNMLLT